MTNDISLDKYKEFCRERAKARFEELTALVKALKAAENKEMAKTSVLSNESSHTAQLS